MPPMPPSHPSAPAGPVMGKGPATPLKPGEGGKMTSAKSRTSNPQCSAAMSAFQLSRHGKPTSMPIAEAMKVLGRCRSEAHGLRRAEANRGAGNEGKAQHLEHRVRTAQQSGGPITQKDRKARALELIAGRRAKQQASVREQAAGTLKPTKSRNTQDRVKRIQDRVYATQQHVADNPTDERAKRFLGRIRGNESLAPGVARDMAAGKPGYFSRFRARNAKSVVATAKPTPEPAGFSTSHTPRKGVTDRTAPDSVVEPWKKAEALKSRAANPRGNVWQRLAKFRDRSALTADALMSAGRKDAAVRAQKRLWQVNWAVKGKGALPKFGREDYASPKVVHPGDVSQAHAAPTGSASNTVKRSTHDLIALTREAKATLPRADRTSFVRGLAASRGKTTKEPDWSVAFNHMKSGGLVEFKNVAGETHHAQLKQEAGLSQIDIYKPGGKRRVATSGIRRKEELHDWLKIVKATPVSPSLKQQAAAHRATKGSARERIGALMAKNDMASRALDTGSLTGKGAKIRRIRKNTAKLDRMLRQTPRPRPSQGRYDSSD